MSYRIFSLVCVLLIVSGITAPAQGPTNDTKSDEHILYQWTDRNNAVNVTDRLDKVPREYRDSVTIIEQGPSAPDPGANKNTAAPHASAPFDDALKHQWQDRMSAARHRVAYADMQYQRVLKEQDDLLKKWGYGLYGYPPEVSRQLELLELQVNKAKREWDEAVENVETTLPEEARKAGIPPGWLRE